MSGPLSRLRWALESGLASVSLSLTFALSSLVVVDVILFIVVFFTCIYLPVCAREFLMSLSCMSEPRGSVSDSRVVSAVYQ